MCDKIGIDMRISKCHIANSVFMEVIEGIDSQKADGNS
jgi:hypothetical protein